MINNYSYLQRICQIFNNITWYQIDIGLLLILYTEILVFSILMIYGGK